MNNLPSLDILYINQLCINDFRCTVADIVHTLHPQHLIFRLELFGCG